MVGRIAACAVVALLCAAPKAARAFTIESPLPGVEACHERISLEAIASTPFPADLPTVPVDDEARRLANGVPFTLPDAARTDPRLVAFLVGIRSPDTDDLALTDLETLGTLHGDPTKQMQHCLRAETDDFAAGDATALAACRAEILAQLDVALGPGDAIDGGTEDVRISLAYEGTRTVTLQRYPYHLGRALHALQDSFTHAYRSDDGHHVLSVHNWVDWVRQGYDPARDGVRHNSDRDHCSGSPEVLARVTHATDASVELLAALSDSVGGRTGRLARAGAVLDSWLGLTSGCDATNAYCAATDAAHPDSSCAAAPGTPSSGALLVALLAGVALVLVRRTRRVAALLVALLALSPVAAHAQDAAHAQTAQDISNDPEPPLFHTWSASATLAGALESPSLAVSLGARWSPTVDWRFGLDVEWSPWFSIAATRGAPGSFNAYVSAQYDWLRYPGVARVGSRLALGISALLFDLPGASAGDVGPYVALTLIGVGFWLGPNWELRIDPEASIAVPHVIGVPLVFREYRLAVSLVWGL